VSDLVVWTGPVANFQVPGATVPGAKELFIGCFGDRPPHCPTIGNQIAGSPSALLAKAGVAELDDLFFGAFSAGGSIIKRMMLNADYRARTTSVHLADATYTGGWVDKANRVPPAIEGFVQYAVDVAEGPGDKLFIATASPNPNFQWATGIENLQSMRHEIEKRTGRTFELVSGLGIAKEPEHTYKLGNVLFGEYSGAANIGHGHTQLAGDIWQNIINPWLAKGKGPVEQPGGMLPPGPGPGPVEPPGPQPWAEPSLGIVDVLVGIGSAAVGFLITRSFVKRWPTGR
jgi:hypothetical protein